MKNIIYILILFSFFSCASSAQTSREISPDIWVREGYKLTIAQADIQQPRLMQTDEKGNLYVSLPEKGSIKTSMDKDGDGYYETVADFVTGHPQVHGMQWHEGWLWYAESGAIFKARDTNGDGKADEKKTIIKEGVLPKGGGHWWRPILVNKGRIYTAIGCSGNIDDETGTDRLKIWSFNEDGSDKKLFAGGVRNTEKLVLRPGTDELWGMDHGSDNMGAFLEKRDKNEVRTPITDYNPPCEMNHYVEGGFYGHPYITGNRMPRQEYMERKDIIEWAAKTTPPAWAAAAHNAPNAMTFYTGNQFPEAMKGNAFVAYHGSWNRSEKGGYRVTHVLFEEGRPYGEQRFVEFLDKNKDVLGRPVDVIVANDGSLLISDDWGHKIYRLTYTGKK
jgi:glucose/arabinose dehydrogenase